MPDLLKRLEEAEVEKAKAIIARCDGCKCDICVRSVSEVVSSIYTQGLEEAAVLVEAKRPGHRWDGESIQKDCAMSELACEIRSLKPNEGKE